MSRSWGILSTVVMGVVLTLACGGGGGGDVVSGGGGGSTIVAASFTPEIASPGANNVSTVGSPNSNIVTVTVMVTGTSDVYGASFDLVFDPTVAEFVGWSPGTLLESGGRQVSYQVNSQLPGRVVVGASRTQPIGGADAGVSTGLIQLRLRANRAGTTSVRFENADLLDSQNPPQDIGGIQFSGGTLVAN